MMSDSQGNLQPQKGTTCRHPRCLGPRALLVVKTFPLRWRPKLHSQVCRLWSRPLTGLKLAGGRRRRRRRTGMMPGGETTLVAPRMVAASVAAGRAGVPCSMRAPAPAASRSTSGPSAAAEEVGVTAARRPSRRRPAARSRRAPSVRMGSPPRTLALSEEAATALFRRRASHPPPWLSAVVTLRASPRKVRLRRQTLSAVFLAPHPQWTPELFRMQPVQTCIRCLPRALQWGFQRERLRGTAGGVLQAVARAGGARRQLASCLRCTSSGPSRRSPTMSRASPRALCAASRRPWAYPNAASEYRRCVQVEHWGFKAPCLSGFSGSVAVT
mmetsp:Transcript_33968/g.94029  ORF Transcript_33968/g.94029 Transcript_33968/m.94029 type:complete len:328 (-) Transcript_33968:149-1132(-)